MNTKKTKNTPKSQKVPPMSIDGFFNANIGFNYLTWMFESSNVGKKSRHVESNIVINSTAI